MKIWQKYIGSSLVTLGLIISATVITNILLTNARNALEDVKDRSSRLVDNAQTLNVLLSEQIIVLKDLLFLENPKKKLEEYEDLKQKFLPLINEIEGMKPSNQEIKVIRRRYESLDLLAKEISRSSLTQNSLAIADIKENFRSINSFNRDVRFYTNKLVEVFEQENKEANQAGEQLNRTEETVKWGITFFILLVFAGQFWLILLPTIQSIQKLQLGAESIGKGNLGYRLDIHTGDEVEQLSYEFNQMSLKLEESYHNLETKVLERTAELSAVNRSLEEEIIERRQAELELQLTLKNLQEAQIQKASADAASTAKSEFLANMSHELRTPLNGILGYVQILQRDRHISPKQLEGVNVIQQCSNHLLNLITDILDLSKIEAQKMELQINNFHFLGFLKNVVEICAVRAEQKGIAFNYQPSSVLPIGVQSDEKRLRQVLINLLGNAIKFTERGGVTFAVNVLPKESVEHQQEQLAENKQPTTDSSYPAYRIRFQITDTGVGMSSEQIEKIFLPFEQVGNSKAKQEGTGLGLAISQKIVEVMGSNIQAKSQLGQGSVFWFDLDLKESPGWINTNRITIPNKITGYAGDRQRVLIVDDKWENRSILVNLLEEIGFETTEAENGQEAIERLSVSRPHLILSDLVMPVMDGFEMVRQIRRVPDWENTVIIITSASVFGEDRQESIKTGANDFLPKPLQFEQLLEKIQKYLKLEWIYEISKESNRTHLQAIASNSNAQLTYPLSAPPLDRIEQLYELAMKGNINGILEELEHLEQIDQQFLPFITELRSLAEDFQVKKIKEFIKLYRGVVL